MLREHVAGSRLTCLWRSGYTLKFTYSWKESGFWLVCTFHNSLHSPSEAFTAASSFRQSNFLGHCSKYPNVIWIVDFASDLWPCFGLTSFNSCAKKKSKKSTSAFLCSPSHLGVCRRKVEQRALLILNEKPLKQSESVGTCSSSSTLWRGQVILYKKVNWFWLHAPLNNFHEWTCPHLWPCIWSFPSIVSFLWITSYFGYRSLHLFASQSSWQTLCL